VTDDFFQTPNVVGDARFHRWRHTQSLVNPAARVQCLLGGRGFALPQVGQPGAITALIVSALCSRLIHGDFVSDMIAAGKQSPFGPEPVPEIQPLPLINHRGDCIPEWLPATKMRVIHPNASTIVDATKPSHVRQS
jgi:hypothetical protein